MKLSAKPLIILLISLLFALLFALAGILLCRVSGDATLSDEKTAAIRKAASAPPDARVSGDANGTATEENPPIRRIVIDAGHGGEDGGAQSRAGLYEKDVNLSVARTLQDLFEAAGIPVVMTRTEDKLLYDRTVDFKGRKKVLDLAGRLTVAQSVPDSLFLSIHMNAFTQTQYSGTQVWYSVKDGRSQDIARSIQSGAAMLDPLNHRKCKAAGSSIYLLDRLDTPAVLVEGGFLSNPEEAARLGNEAYRQELALMILASVLSTLQAG